jgi:hypothetical protein
MPVEWNFHNQAESMRRAKEEAELLHPSPLKSYVYRLVDNREVYPDHLINIQAYPVIKHSPKSFLYQDIHPTRWRGNKNHNNNTTGVRRQYDNSGSRSVFFTPADFLRDYIRRKKRQHQIHQQIADLAIRRLEFAQLAGNVPAPAYRIDDDSFF